MASPPIISFAEVARHYQLFLTTQTKLEVVRRLNEEVNQVDMAALKRLSESILRTTCGDPVWIASGGFKLVFGMTTEGKGDVVARVCRRNINDAGEITRRILSEVATVDWVRRTTSIPVPEIYGYEADTNCDVGSAFILEKRVLGCPADAVILYQCPDLGSNFINQVIGYYNQLLNNPVSAIGVFEPGTGGQEPSIGAISPGLGPFLSSDAWCKALAEKMQAFLQSEQFVTEWRFWHPQPSVEPDRQCIQAQFDAVLAAHQILSRKHRGDGEHLVVQHIDLDFPNVLVDFHDPSKVVAIIDWDGALAVPLWEVSCLPPVLGGDCYCSSGSTSEQPGATVWERLTMWQTQSKEFLEDAHIRHKVRQMLGVKYYYTGPATYNIKKELDEVSARLGLERGLEGSDD